MHCPFLLLVTFIFIDTLTNRANKEGRRLEVSGAEIERLKKGKSLTTIHKHNWQIEVCSVTSIKIEQPYIANVSAGLSQTHWHSVIQIITQLAKQFKLTVTTQQQAQRRSSSPPYPLPPPPPRRPFSSDSQHLQMTESDLSSVPTNLTLILKVSGMQGAL